MNIYLISQSKATGYDSYDSAVVAAPSAKAARKIHPDSKGRELCECGDGAWAIDPEDVTAELIGKAGPKVAAGVICASFNAG